MTVQELYEIVRKEIDVRASIDPAFRQAQRKIDNGNGDFTDSAQCSRFLSKFLGEQLAKHILELPPDEGRSELCQQLLKDFFDELSQRFERVQSRLDRENGVGLATVEPDFPAERVQNVAGSLNDTTVSDETIQRRCRNAVANVANTMHDSFIQVNAKFRNNVGLFVQVTRTGGAECCDWCAQVSGTFWGYNRDLREVFRRHDNCTCTITYTSSKTRSRLVGESDGAGGTTSKWVESRKSWQEKPIFPDVRPTRFTPEQAKQFEAKQLRKQGLVRDGDGVKYVGNGMAEDRVSGSFLSPNPLELERVLEENSLTSPEKSDRIKSGIPYLDEMPVLLHREIEDCYNTTNPNWKKSPWYQVNCQRCVAAYEARRRGFDVIARSSYKGDPIAEEPDCLTGWGSMFKITRKDVISVPAKTGQEAIKLISAQMSKYGEGARAIVKVHDNGIHGHVFIAEQINGRLRLVDPQVSQFDASPWLTFGMYDLQRTELLRIDDKEFTDVIEDCVEEG